MIISVFTTIALILQIGAFVVHAHSIVHEDYATTITNEQSKYSHHCDICDAVLKIAIDSCDVISFVNSSILLPYYCLPTLSFKSFTVDRTSSRAPPQV
ncbi:hypothetical protein EBV26_02875 [bacterium]|nr:hypothetical protein [bacterium]